MQPCVALCREGDVSSLRFRVIWPRERRRSNHRAYCRSTGRGTYTSMSAPLGATVRGRASIQIRVARGQRGLMAVIRTIVPITGGIPRGIVAR